MRKKDECIVQKKRRRKEKRLMRPKRLRNLKNEGGLAKLEGRGKELFGKTTCPLLSPQEERRLFGKVRGKRGGRGPITGGKANLPFGFWKKRKVERGIMWQARGGKEVTLQLGQREYSDGLAKSRLLKEGAGDLR